MRRLSLGFAVVGVLAWLTTATAQSSDADRLAQCQAKARVKQDMQTGAEQIAAGLLVRAEKAEAQVKELEAQVKALEAKEPKPHEEAK